MDNRMSNNQEVITKRRKTKKIWKSIVSVLACIVVFCTTYALILPAITLEAETYCGKKEHSHGEECYSTELICTLTEESETVKHKHKADCYIEEKALICSQEESEGHTHGEACQKLEEELVCGQEESEEHAHTDECYEEKLTYVCGQEESEGHLHTDECYEVNEKLVCELETEGITKEHVHTESCYEKKFTCELVEHTHTKICYSNKEADVETATDWENTLPKELTGVWADDVLAVADSQLGYTESTRNYVVDDDGETRGYTRYGDWYGDSYGHWCAMFASFCLEYAKVDEALMPHDASCQNWIETLSKEKYQLYHEVGTYDPVPGDLIFFNWDDLGDSDHVGFVYEVIEATDEHGVQVKTIEGNASDTVKYRTYDIDDESIMGYGQLPENPEVEEEEKVVEEEEKGVLAKVFSLAKSAESTETTESTTTTDSYAPGITLTGEWNADMLAIAESQVGKNNDTGKYDEWYTSKFGTATTDWTAQFITYCLYYAGVPQTAIPYYTEGDMNSYITQLKQSDFYFDKGDGTPQVGDLVIGYPSYGNDPFTVGIVKSLQQNGNAVNAIVAFSNGTVQATGELWGKANGFVRMPKTELSKEISGILTAKATCKYGTVPAGTELVINYSENGTNETRDSLVEEEVKKNNQSVRKSYYLEVCFMLNGEKINVDNAEIEVDFSPDLPTNAASIHDGKTKAQEWKYYKIKSDTVSGWNYSEVSIEPYNTHVLQDISFVYEDVETFVITSAQNVYMQTNVGFGKGTASVSAYSASVPNGAELVVNLSEEPNETTDALIENEFLMSPLGIRKNYYLTVYFVKNGEKVEVDVNEAYPIEITLDFSPDLSPNKDTNSNTDITWEYRKVGNDNQLVEWNNKKSDECTGNSELSKLSFTYEGESTYTLTALQEVYKTITKDTDFGKVTASFNGKILPSDVELVANLVTDENLNAAWENTLRTKYKDKFNAGEDMTNIQFLEVYFTQNGQPIEPKEGHNVNISVEFSGALASNASTYEKCKDAYWLVDNISTDENGEIIAIELANDKTFNMNENQDITSFQYVYEKADAISLMAMQEAYTFVESEIALADGKVKVSAAGKITVLPKGTKMVVEFVETTEDSSIVAALRAKHETEERYSLSEILLFTIKFLDAEGNEFTPSEPNLVDINLTFDPAVSSAFEDGTVTIGEWVMDYVSVTTEDAAETATATTPGEADAVQLSMTEDFELTEASFVYTEQQYYAISAKMDDPDYKTEVEVTDFEELQSVIENAGSEKTVITILEDFASDDTITVGENKNIVINLNGKTITASKTLFDVDGGRLTIEDSEKKSESTSEQGVVNVSADANQDEIPVSDMIGKTATYDSTTDKLIYYVTESDVTNTDTGATKETLVKHEVTLTGKISGGNNAISVINVSSGHCNLNSGAIVECATSAIYQDGGTLKLNGGYICGNKTSGSGAAINVNGSGKTILDGTVLAANQAGIDGGAIAINNAESFVMNGGVISGNVCVASGNGSGGGVFSQGNTPVTINGGYITNNRCDGTNYYSGGGAIYTRENSTIYMNDGYITGNYVGGGGGGLRTSSWSMFMNGGYVNSNYAETAEGGGVSVDQPCVAYVYGGYINNNVSNTYEHWGGGGLFCANDSTLYMRNALVTENKAGGYGGGVAGCSTGRTFICEHNGGAIFDNTACKPGESHLSGGTSTKNEDHQFITEMFLKYGYADYFSAFNSVVGGTMLGGEPANWRGSIDGVPVRASASDTLISSYLMGLTSHPTEVGKQNAYDNSKVYINGNDSFTHGGGILCNGYMVIGDVTEVEVFSRLKVKASKILLDESENKLALADKQFEFELINKATGDVVATGTNDTDGNITFDHMIPFTEEGEYIYLVSEKTDVNNEGLIMDSTDYEIRVTVERRKQPNLHVHIEKYRYEITWIEVDRIDENGRTNLVSEDPVDQDQYPVELSLTEGPSFVNAKRATTKVSVIKQWEGIQQENGISVTIQLNQNGNPYDTVMLSAENEWKYEWAELPLEAVVDGETIYYTYTVEEVNVPEGYKVQYDTSITNNDSQVWRENTKALEAQGKYIIVSPDGKYVYYQTNTGNVTSIESIPKESIFNAILRDDNVEKGYILYNINTGYQTLNVSNEKLELNWNHNTNLYVGDTRINYGSNETEDNTYAVIYENGKFSVTEKSLATAENSVKLYTPYVTLGDPEIIFTVTNKKIDEVETDFGLKIKKVDSSDHNILLAGAHFELYYADANGELILTDGKPNAVTFTRKSAGEYEYCVTGSEEITTDLVIDTVTNNLGSIKLSKLPAGNYILRETIAPNGYIEVTDQKITLGDTSDPEVELLLEDEREEEDGFILPETGGPGTNVYTAGGILLLMISVLLYIKRKNQTKGGRVFN